MSGFNIGFTYGRIDNGFRVCHCNKTQFGSQYISLLKIQWNSQFFFDHI